MTAFAAAMDVIFDDPDMAAAALWLAGAAPPGVVIRAIWKRPDEVTDFGGARLWSDTCRIDVRTADVPNPRPGDRIVIGDEEFEIQGEPVRDRERLIWTLDLRPA